jgi:replication factor A1
MSFATMDHSGQVWMQGFNEVGQAMFGMTADELHDMQVCVSCA